MKRTLLTIVAVAALVALCAAPAFAEGYNDGGINYNLDNGLGGFNDSGVYAGNAGIYVRTPASADQEQSFTGPHGGYTTTTNKCQDCHSTHYATGSYKLLRANSAAAACDFCHGGGGGSSVNIMMDNEYKAQGADLSDGVAVIAPLGDDAGMGVGHTLGYKGNAPADIDPAFSDPNDGLACFSCHTPHGNSARILQAFGSPARPAGPGEVTKLVGVSFMAAQMFRIQESMGVAFDFGDFNGFTGQAYPQNSYMPIPEDLSKLPHDLDGSAIVKWTGADTEIGNVIRNSNTNGAAVNMTMGSGEVGQANTLFFAWLGMPPASRPLPPTPAQMGTWRNNPANFTAAPVVGGKYGVSDQGVGALFSLFGVTQMANPTLSDWALVNLFMKWKVYWGQDTQQGNITTAFLNMGDWQVGGSVMPMFPNYGLDAMPELEVWHKPLFPKGRFLLLKNPDSGDDATTYSYNPATGSGTGTNEMGVPSPDSDALFGSPAAPAGKKVAIDWEWPIGPAASWGPFFSTDGNERFPLAFPWAPKGVAMENEMCSSCHDGAAGMSKEVASVWRPNPTTVTDLDGEYINAYSHDSNARGCARAQFLNTDDDNNFGPHCANCHTGSSSCQTCHSEEGENWESFGRDAYDANDSGFVEGVTSYKAPAAVRTRAVANINTKCLDGGFSYPHRTMGANMLKDNLWGVNFDGTAVAAGQLRSMNGTGAAQTQADLQSFFTTGRSFESTHVIGQVAHNLDSVCIDCHGDATYYDEGAYAEFTSYNPLSATGQNWEVKGWSLLLKGLP